MKYLSQFVIIIAVTVAAELIKFLIPLPIPASIYGLALMFLLLKSGILKLSAVEDVANFLLGILPLILVPTSVSFITAMDEMLKMLPAVLLMGVVGTLAVMFVTGRVAQWVSRRKGGRSHD